MVRKYCCSLEFNDLIILIKDYKYFDVNVSFLSFIKNYHSFL